MDSQIYSLLLHQLPYKESQIRNSLHLREEGATLPFIARYRKEQTLGLDEVELAEIFNASDKLQTLVKRKATIQKAIEGQGKLTPELLDALNAIWDEDKLEDFYLPYKQKRKTKASIAKELGLEPLAKIIMSRRSRNIEHEARKYCVGQVSTIDEAISGAQDIIAEWISENMKVRDITRKTLFKSSLHSKVVAKKKDEAQKYRDYFDFTQPIQSIPSHRVLAMNRGESEGLLKVKLVYDQEWLEHSLERFFKISNSESDKLIAEAIKDSLKRLILPSIENEVRKRIKEKADKDAIGVFSKNANQLLLLAPLGEKRVLAIDPGYRTGCKVVVLDANGNLIDNTTIFPHPPQRQLNQAEKVLYDLVHNCGIEAIAIGNGTAGRETYKMVNNLKFEKVEVYLVNEDGASIYSASDIAREEFPKQDVTVRGAISIGRRLMDPLAELVKIDPKSIGVGQYQHDVDQTLLKSELEATVTQAVNAVGINLNTASASLLTYVSGLGPAIAKNIIDYRSLHGSFQDRKSLLKVPKLGKKAYEQCAGFLRVKAGNNPLDNSAVHPERYALVNRIAQEAGTTIDQLIGNTAVLNNLQLKNYIDQKTGLPTLQDIVKELRKPGLDPRGKAEMIQQNIGIDSIQDLAIDMVLHGTVVNLTNFGAFVDIGIKESALLHISQITDRFISDPSEVLSLQQALHVKILEIDIPRKRISVTLRH